MEDITDPPFRKICKWFGADVVISEFISSEGLLRDADKSIKKLDFTAEERPIGIQIFGHDIDSMKRASEVASSAKPDFIDINFGCPVRKVVNKGGGAAALKNLPLMEKMASAVVKSTSIPVTAKTRLGWDENNKNIEEVAMRLQESGVEAIIVHGRTRSQFYKGTSDWTLIGKLVDNPKITVPIIGNGDICNGESARQAYKNYNTDGLMIGRAAMGNPWIFRSIKHYFETGINEIKPPIEERVDICRKHLHMEMEWKGERRAVMEMRKLYGGYFSGIKNFKPYRIKLVSLDSIKDIDNVLDEISFEFQTKNQ